MKKVISLLTLILCAMLIITGCDPATTTPGTGGNTTIPSNPDDNPLIPDDKPSNDAELLEPSPQQENIINKLHIKLQELLQNEKTVTTYESISERLFNNSKYEADVSEEEEYIKSFTANGNLTTTQYKIGDKINGKVKIDIDNGKEYIFEAKNFEITFIDGQPSISGELKVNGEKLTEKNFSLMEEIGNYLYALKYSNELSDYTESIKQEISHTFDGMTLKEVFIGSIDTNGGNISDAVIAEYNGNILKIGYTMEITNIEQNEIQIDYISVNKNYISVGKCSEEIKTKLMDFAPLLTSV